MSEITLTAETLVKDVAARYPATLRTMEALGIDYCCGGKKPLAEATAAAGVPVQTAIAVLQAAIAQAAGAQGAAHDWTQAPLGELMEHILDTHHTYMDREMPRLEAILLKVARVHGPNHADVLQPLVREYTRLKEDLTLHLKKEEDVTFPAIARVAAGEDDHQARTTIQELGEEHDAAGEILAAMRQATSNYALPEDACGTYAALYDGLQAMEQDIHRHIHLENNILFPRALSAIGPCTCAH